MKHPAILLRSAIAFILPLVLLSACSSTDADMKTFIGQPSSVLLAQLGTPKLRAPDGKGGEIWTYLEESEGFAPGMAGLNSQGPRNNVGGGSLSQPVQTGNGFTARREFLIDSHGVVFQYRSRGH